MVSINRWGKTWATPTSSPVQDDEDVFYVVPNNYRSRVVEKRTKNSRPITSPIIEAVISGKTVLIDAHLPILTRGIATTKWKNLYASLSARGYKLRMHVMDVPEKEVFRGILVWAEPMTVLWNCTRCGNLEAGSPNVKPERPGCNGRQRTDKHDWRILRNFTQETRTRLRRKRRWHATKRVKYLQREVA